METEYDRQRRLKRLREEGRGYEMDLAIQRQEQRNRQLRARAHPSTFQRVGNFFGSMAPPPQRAHTRTRARTKARPRSGNQVVHYHYAAPVKVKRKRRRSSGDYYGSGNFLGV